MVLSAIALAGHLHHRKNSTLPLALIIGLLVYILAANMDGLPSSPL